MAARTREAMEELRELLAGAYGLVPSQLKLLEGYEDRTYQVLAGEVRYILKSQRASDMLRERVALENQLTQSLKSAETFDFPRPVPAKDGGPYRELNGKLVRLLTYLEGTFLAEIPKTNTLLESLGDFLGRLNRASMELNPGSLAGEVSDWDLQHLEMFRTKVPKVESPRDRALISYYLLQFESEVLPQKSRLRKALIHNDANDWNVLTQNGRVSGIIDFGDMCYSWLIGELAVALPYVLAEQEDPLGAAAMVVGAYHRIVPLEALEVKLLYYLIAGRICMSLCNSAEAKKKQPESAYVSISEASMKKLLRQWIRIAPERARDVFLKATGHPAVASPDVDAMLQRRKKLLAPSLSLSYKNPIAMSRAAFQYMFDLKGQPYLDAYNNIMLVGHCHPKVVEAASRVMRRLNTNTRYLYKELLDYGEHLLRLFPPELSRVFLVNSGSAATDLALRLSKAYTSRQKILALESGYHGNTIAAIEVSHYKHRAGETYPYTLLGPMPKVFGSGLPDDGTAGEHFAAFFLDRIASNRGEVAAFLAEPIMGCGGQVPLPAGFLAPIYDAVRQQGGVCISDEVQVGFGRLGTWNWGYEKYGVVPDLVILGKPMGNGHPIGAVVTTGEIASCFDSGPEFFSSFGGNPVSCAAGLAVLEIVEEEGLREHAADTGNYLMQAFRELAGTFPGIGDVRGEGLFIGVEMLTADGKEDTTTAQFLKNRLRETHILVGTDGPANNVLKIKPPLPFNRENCDVLIRETVRILKNHGES